MQPEQLQRAKNTLWKCLKRQCPDYIVDVHNAPALTAAAAWMVQAPGTGILLMGPVGTGKTDLMRALSQACTIGGGMGFKVVNAARVVADFQRKGDDKDAGGTDAMLRLSETPHLCIDDIGIEQEGKHFGKVSNVIAELIQLRYERWRQGRCITHFTTNCDGKMLADHYDERTLSRLLEMCAEVQLFGGDRRPYSKPTAQAIMPPLFQDEKNENMPTVEEAAVHFEKIRTAIKEAAKEVTNTARLTVVTSETSQDADLEAFRKKCEKLTDAQLFDMRGNIEQENHAAAAEPWLRVIDAEVNSRKSEKVA